MDSKYGDAYSVYGTVVPSEWGNAAAMRPKTKTRASSQLVQAHLRWMRSTCRSFDRCPQSVRRLHRLPKCTGPEADTLSIQQIKYLTIGVS